MSGVLKYATIVVLLSISPFMSVGVCLMYRGAPMLEKAMATHSSTLAWKIPQTEGPGRLQSMGSQKSRKGLSDFTHSLVHPT